MEDFNIKAKICYIYQDQYPWDIRVEKITNTLAENGIAVYIISRNRDGLPRNEQYSDRIYIHRLGDFYYIIRDIINFPAFFSPFWLQAIISTVKKNNLDLIIVRDLPLAITAWIAGKITKRPVILDMAENYPAMIQDTWKYRGPKLLDYFIRNPFFLKYMEKFILSRLNGVIVVSEASAERVKKMGIKREFIYLVGNTPYLKNVIDDKVAIDIRNKSNFILMYIGGLEEVRGLEILIRALPKVVKVEPNVLLVLIGKGTSEPKLKLLAEQLGIENNILWMGWQDHKIIPSFINSSDICFIPHYVTEHTNTTIPNKIFDYMLQKKPIIATNSETLSEIINSSRCGLIYKDNDPNELADSIIALRSKELREALGRSGYDAVLKKYNWELDKFKLLQAVASTLHNYLLNNNARK